MKDYKQWGGVNLPAYLRYVNRQAGKKKNGRVLKERTWEEMPKIMDAV